MPRRFAGQLVTAWMRYNLELAQQPDLTAPFAHHCHQSALSLALAETGIPFRPLPLALNLPVHLTHLAPPPALLRTDPAIVHHHDRVDGDGGLLASGYPLTDRRIAEFNRRWAASDAGPA